jgi:hypothetical protein
MSVPENPGAEPPELTEEQMRQLQAEMDRVRISDLLLQTIVNLVNLAARKAGLAPLPGEEPKPDWPEVRAAIEAVRALLPQVEADHGPAMASIKDAVAQLQMVYAQQAGGQPAPAPQAPPPPSRPGQGDAQASGRLWVPGQ